MLLTQGPSVRQIVECDLGIGVGKSSIWCRLEKCGGNLDQMMIQISLHGNWITFSLEFERNSFHLFYSEHMDVPPCKQHYILKHEFHRRSKLRMKSW